MRLAGRYVYCSTTVAFGEAFFNNVFHCENVFADSKEQFANDIWTKPKLCTFRMT